MTRCNFPKLHRQHGHPTDCSSPQLLMVMCTSGIRRQTSRHFICRWILQDSDSKGWHGHLTGHASHLDIMACAMKEWGSGKPLISRCCIRGPTVPIPLRGHLTLRRSRSAPDLPRRSRSSAPPTSARRCMNTFELSQGNTNQLRGRPSLAPHRASQLPAGKARTMRYISGILPI